MENYNGESRDESSRIGDANDFTSEFPFMKALMTGLAIGITDTVLCLGYNLLYRDGGHGFFSSDIINVSSIIFGTNIMFIVIGVLFFAFAKRARKGEMAFSILFIVLTIIGAIVASQVHRSADPDMNARFHGLLVGVVLIIGVSAAIGMPVLYHSRKFGQYVL
jgi:branched-subunit amino acid transport protein